MKQIVLASQSPRRKEILGFFSLPFEQMTPDFDEELVIFEGNPDQYVCELAKRKAESLMKQIPNAIIIAADTTVYCDGKLYNKPKTEAEAFQSLSELVGKWHSVYSGIAICDEGDCYVKAEETKVLFNFLTPDEIRRYHRRIHWADKAGGYSIQMGGGLIVKKIEGCFYNVMGLPINSLHELLKKIGIELWDYVK